MKPTRPKYLSVKEVTAILPMDIKTVYKKIKLGEIPGHFKLGSMHFIDEEEFYSGLKKLATTPHKSASKVHQTRTDKYGLMK